MKSSAISLHYAEGTSVSVLQNSGFVSFVSSFLFPNQFHASGFFALPSKNFVLAFPDYLFSDQSQAVQTWVQMGTSDWLEGRSTCSSHLPPSTQVLVAISSLGRSGVTGPWLSLIVPFPRWILALSSGLPVQLWSLIYLALHCHGHCSFYLQIGCHSDSNTFRELSDRHSHTSM